MNGAAEASNGEYKPEHNLAEFYSEQLVLFDTIGAFYELAPNSEAGSGTSASVDHVPWSHSFEHRSRFLSEFLQSPALSFLNGDLVSSLQIDDIVESRLYSCIQHCGKFHPLFDEALLSILEADPKAILILRHCGGVNEETVEDRSFSYSYNITDDLGRQDDSLKEPSFRTRLENNLGTTKFRAISQRILVLKVQLSLRDLLRLIGCAHVALESFPFPASITTLDAFTVRFPSLRMFLNIPEVLCDTLFLRYMLCGALF